MFFCVTASSTQGRSNVSCVQLVAFKASRGGYSLPAAGMSPEEPEELLLPKATDPLRNKGPCDDKYCSGTVTGWFIPSVSLMGTTYECNKCGKRTLVEPPKPPKNRQV
eukprot:g23109.t1